MGGSYAGQGYDSDGTVYPTCIPPLSCDRPEYAPFLVAHWAYALAIDPRLIIIRPTTTYEGMEDIRRPDGGFMVVLVIDYPGVDNIEFYAFPGLTNLHSESGDPLGAEPATQHPE